MTACGRHDILTCAANVQFINTKFRPFAINQSGIDRFRYNFLHAPTKNRVFLCFCRKRCTHPTPPDCKTFWPRVECPKNNPPRPPSCAAEVKVADLLPEMKICKTWPKIMSAIRVRWHLPHPHPQQDNLLSPADGIDTGEARSHAGSIQDNHVPRDCSLQCDFFCSFSVDCLVPCHTNRQSLHRVQLFQVYEYEVNVDFAAAVKWIVFALCHGQSYNNVCSRLC